MTNDIDAQISSLLRLGEVAVPDERFIANVMFQIEAEQRFQAVRARANTDLTWKGAACLVVIVAFVLLGRMEPPMGTSSEISFFSPAMLGVLVLTLWAAVDLSPKSFAEE